MLSKIAAKLSEAINRDDGRRRRKVAADNEETARVDKFMPDLPKPGTLDTFNLS
ncbi:MAG TPA: hypothetical protein VMQ11_17820 [Alphaproteobacteria bacterium]|nr:hypothetical protein [Alphaproteobacteria bacterium]